MLNFVLKLGVGVIFALSFECGYSDRQVWRDHSRLCQVRRDLHALLRGLAAPWVLVLIQIRCSVNLNRVLAHNFVDGGDVFQQIRRLQVEHGLLYVVFEGGELF